MADPFSQPGDSEPDAAIGPALRAARKRIGLTGAELARRAGISQAKVSRLETGRSSAAPAEVHLLAAAMGLGVDESETLVSLARQAQRHMTDWRTPPRGMPQRQDQISRIEREGSEVRVFNPAVVPGLLQTSSYAKAVIASLSALVSADPAAPETQRSLLAAVSRRMARQEILGAATKRFSFVITESVLGTGVGTPEDMLVQIRQLRQLHMLPNISLKILPARAFVVDFALHSFEVIDNRAVLIDLFNTSMTAQSRADIRLYLDLFERLERAATADVEALFDEYVEHYRRQIGVSPAD